MEVRHRVEVETASDLTRGMTVVDRLGRAGDAINQAAWGGAAGSVPNVTVLGNRCSTVETRPLECAARRNREDLTVAQGDPVARTFVFVQPDPAATSYSTNGATQGATTSEP